MVDYQEEAKNQPSEEIREVSPGRTFEIEGGREYVLGGDPDPSKRPGAVGVKFTDVPVRLPANLLSLKVTPASVIGEPLSSSYQIAFDKKMIDGTQVQANLSNTAPLGANVSLSIMAENGVLKLQDIAQIQDPGEPRKLILAVDWVSR